MLLQILARSTMIKDQTFWYTRSGQQEFSVVLFIKVDTYKPELCFIGLCHINQWCWNCKHQIIMMWCHLLASSKSNGSFKFWIQIQNWTVMSIYAVTRMQGQQGRRRLGHKCLCVYRTESDLLHKFPCRLTTVFMSTWLLFFVFPRLKTRWNIHVFLNTAIQDSVTELDFIWHQRVLCPVQQLKRAMSGRCVSWSEVPQAVRQRGHRHAKGGGYFQRHQLANHTGQVTPGTKGETTDDNMS